ncbi:ATP-binding cassette domain-containing protein [Mesomycoplasma molare]|uniref:ATP-binding cassette domain-containing protein n=1 Tax=Mesomycoplasma molare TaxID=171288 RepID=A0ABY5TUF9_9BACT|nr:ABC transporter ATP-binding protein [Mesomycoplasma molare]UWD34287.1 ATP-binding cassette domain-containing protein [Mesomycoplasma molare]
MRKIILKDKNSYFIFAYLLFLIIVNLFSLFFQIEAIKILFNFSERNSANFFVYQLLSLSLELLWQSFKSFANIFIKKQIYVITVYKKSQIFNSLKNYKPSKIKESSVTEYIFDLEINLNQYITNYVEIFYNIFWNISLFFCLLIFIIVESIILSPWILLFLLFIFFSLFSSIFFPYYAAKKTKKMNKKYLEIKKNKMAHFSDLVSNFKFFYWFNKMNNFSNSSNLTLLEIHRKNTHLYRKKSKFLFMENFINAFIEQINFISFSLITIFNPISKIIVSISESIFSSIKNLTKESLEDYKEFKINKNLEERIEKFKILDNKNEFKKYEIKEMEIKNLNLKFNNNYVFNNFNYKFLQNKKYLIKGKSGIGKTSLINILLNNLNKNYYNAEIYFNSKQAKEEDFFNLYDNLIYINNQELEYNISAESVLTLFDKIASQKNKYVKDNALIDFDLNQSFDKLSTGQKQRVKIARWFYFEEKNILILDEALSAIDKDTRIKIINNISKKKNAIIISISHYHSEEEEKEFDFILEF